MGEANEDARCLGVITWMHTFSPAKMWSAGLDALRKPLLHLHTQADAALPWATIDMDFMNLNQAAHGDREYGFMLTRLRRAADHRRRARRQPARPRADRILGAGRSRRRGSPWSAGRAVRRQHAQRRRHRGRQGRGRDPVRHVGQHLGGQRPGRRGRRRGPTRPSTRWSTEYGDLYEMDAEPRPRRGAARGRAVPGPHRGGAARIPGRRRLRRLHHQLRGPRRPAPAARTRRAAADGRRLRVRRRGRLEDLGAAARAQGRRAPGWPAARPSWRTTPTTWRRATRRSWGRTCSRCARPSPARRPRVEVHPLASAAARTRPAWCSPPHPGPAW